MRIALLGLVFASFLASPARADSDQKECKSAFGTTACGYSCVAAVREVKCAPNPDGVCVAAYGEVTCTQGHPRRHRRRARRVEKQECKSAFGTTACGYSCVAAFGEVKCAPEPDGVCTAAFGQVVCSD
jgi:hypothetical protein